MVQAVAFRPDGRMLASASSDHTVRLWPVDDLQHPVVLTGHASVVDSMLFGPDGHTLVTGGYDSTVRLWETDVDRVAQRVCEVVAPPITRAEWDFHFPGLDYTPPCPERR